MAGGLACLVFGHEPIPERSGTARHTIRWRCFRCLADLGSSTVPPSPSLMGRLKRNRSRRTLRLIATSGTQGNRA